MYFIYAKTKDMKRFQAIDLSSGSTVNNLMYATMLENKDQANKVLLQLQQQNKNIDFKIKDENGKETPKNKTIKIVCSDTTNKKQCLQDAEVKKHIENYNNLVLVKFNNVYSIVDILTGLMLCWANTQKKLLSDFKEKFENSYNCVVKTEFYQQKIKEFNSLLKNC